MSKDNPELLARIEGVKKHYIQPLTAEQIACVEKYTSRSKLYAVCRWKNRMTKAGLTATELAKKMKRKNTRISEWVNLKHEPLEGAFLQVEEILYKQGA